MSRYDWYLVGVTVFNLSSIVLNVRDIWLRLRRRQTERLLRRAVEDRPS